MHFFSRHTALGIIAHRKRMCVLCMGPQMDCACFCKSSARGLSVVVGWCLCVLWEWRIVAKPNITTFWLANWRLVLASPNCRQYLVTKILNKNIDRRHRIIFHDAINNGCANNQFPRISQCSGENHHHLMKYLVLYRTSGCVSFDVDGLMLSLCSWSNANTYNTSVQRSHPFQCVTMFDICSRSQNTHTFRT